VTAEQWRDIAGYSGAYQISDQGRILSVARRCGGRNRYTEFSRRVPAKILQPRRSSDGRLVVELCRDGRGEKVQIAITVLETFVGPRPKGHYCEFRNGDATDCRLVNLYWRKQDWGGRGRKLKTLVPEGLSVELGANGPSTVSRKILRDTQVAS
jgi:hypothetical protein